MAHFKGNEPLLINGLNAGAVIGEIKDPTTTQDSTLTHSGLQQSTERIQVEYIKIVMDSILDIKGKCMHYLNMILEHFDKSGQVLTRNVALMSKVVDIFIKNTNDPNLLIECLNLATKLKKMLHDPFLENGFEEHIKNSLDVKYQSYVRQMKLKRGTSFTGSRVSSISNSVLAARKFRASIDKVTSGGSKRGSNDSSEIGQDSEKSQKNLA